MPAIQTRLVAYGVRAFPSVGYRSPPGLTFVDSTPLCFDETTTGRAHAPREPPFARHLNSIRMPHGTAMSGGQA